MSEADDSGSHGPDGEGGGTSEPPSPQELRLERDRMYEFWVLHRAELLAMPRRFTSVKAGLPLAADPEELVSEALCRFVGYIARSKTSEELKERSAKSRDLGYIYRALEHLNTDDARRRSREHPVAPDQIVDFLEEPDSDESIENRSSPDQERLGTIIEVLRARAEGPSPRLTCLTLHHIACWQAVLKGHGAQAVLAKELDVHPSRITQLKKSAHAKICETVYVAGVLGPQGGLDDPVSIGRCLDVYDSTAESHTYMTPGDRVRLSTAADAVTITEVNGQRVDPRRAADLFLRRKDKKNLRAQATGADGSGLTEFMTAFAYELHYAETLQARGADVKNPNCASVCAPHNPDGTDRVIWEVEMP